MSVGSRIEKLEREAVPESCPLCAQREAIINVRLPGCTEELIDTVPTNCPECGREFTTEIIVVKSRGQNA